MPDARLGYVAPLGCLWVCRGGSSISPPGIVRYSNVEREVQIDLEVGTGTALEAGLEWWGHMDP